MVSSFTTNKRIEKPAFNDYVDNWDDPVNANWDIIDKGFGGLTTVNLNGLSGVVLLTPAQYGALKIRLTGAPAGNTVVTVPNLVGGLWVVHNDATGTHVESFASATAPTVLVAAPQGTHTLITCDGTVTGMTLAINAPPAAGGALTQIQYHGTGGVLTGSVDLTWNDATKVLTAAGLINKGNTQLGNNPSDVVTTVGSKVSINGSFGLNFQTDQFVLLPAVGSNKPVAIGTSVVLPADTLTVAGRIRSTTGGIVFPNGSVQLVAAVTGGGGSVAGSDTMVQYNDGGASFGAEAGFTYNKTANLLSAPALALAAPLPVLSGGTGVTTSTGTGAGVHAASPALSGTPTAPNAAPAAAGTSQIATVATVQASAGQTVSSQVTTIGAGLTGVIPFDTTVPQAGEGSPVISLAITPKNAASKLTIRVEAMVSASAIQQFTLALFKDAETAARRATGHEIFAATQTVALTYSMVSGGTTAISFAVRGGTTGGTWTLNGDGSGQLYGAAGGTTIVITETP